MILKLAIVIPTYNRISYLKKLLLNIKSQLSHSLFSSDLYVVIDGSNDGTIEMLISDFPDVHIIQGTGNWWFTKSLNEGCKMASLSGAEYILTFNDDVEVSSNYFNKLYDTLVKAEKNSLIGALSLSTDKPHLVTFSGIIKMNKIFLRQIPYIPYFQKYTDDYHGIHPSKSLVTRGMIIPTKLLLDLNYFDEKFPQYGSDEDFCLRAIQKGYKALISFDLIIFSHFKLTSKGTPFIKPGAIEYIKSFFNKYSVNSISKQIRFYRRHGIPCFLPIFLIVYFVASIRAFFFKYNELV